LASQLTTLSSRHIAPACGISAAIWRCSII
jgi:hypothetical protein